jgi:hypothetical protein
MISSSSIGTLIALCQKVGVPRDKLTSFDRNPVLPLARALVAYHANPE